MHLLLVQLLLLLPLGKARQHPEGSQNPSSLSLVLVERNRRELPTDNHEEAEEKPDLFVSVPRLIGASPAAEEQRQREEMLSSFGSFWEKPERELHPPGDLVSEHFRPRTQPLTQSMDGMEMEKSLQEEAKKFWHHFMFRKSPVSQGIILPIKSHDVHHETCRTVPFSQTITHEDCEKVVIENNLCFGKCGSVHFPVAAQHPQTFCSHCSPAKFSTMHVRLNCPGRVPVVKALMLVEECQCKVNTEHRNRHLLQSGSQAELHAQDSFIPGFST
ncbi:cerberus [Choloepus didactylus]|uniref:cerberus n=1 Tax=Choloepus didactylus TaxID=27675 RepID=UPI00189E6DCF|nr:cerberus [Choloepus didactylus]